MSAPVTQAHSLQRLVMLTAVLSAAGSRGWPALALAEHLRFGGTTESKRESLAREIRRLRSIGIEITNAADPGTEARYVLHPSDSRIRLAFDPEQRAQLARAALIADRRTVAEALGGAPASSVPEAPVTVGATGSPGPIDAVSRAVAARCRLAFTYNGRRRVLDPAALVHGATGWAVTGVERTVGQRRTFSVSRMTNVRLDPPGTADVAPGDARGGRGTDPLTWPVDPPVRAEVRGDARYGDDLARLLGSPLIAARTDGTVTAVYRVTNRWVFLARIIELGERVRLDGPDELRAELRERLLAAIEGGA